MQTSCEKRENGDIVLTITIPWPNVGKVYQEVLDDIVKETELPGFRKGKAPKEKVEETVDKNKAYEEVLKRLLPEVYAKALTEHGIKPIISPHITLEKAEEGKDWIVKTVTCERPKVIVGDYKKTITEAKNEKRNKIWVPGKNEDKEKEEQKKELSLDEMLAALVKEVTVTIPPILLEQEVTRLLSNLIDQTKKLGLTIDQYITATGRTSENLRKEYEEEAKRTITLELALEEIAEKEGVSVEDKEIDDVIASSKTPEEKQALAKERYYLASVLRRQKTLKTLSSL